MSSAQENFNDNNNQNTNENVEIKKKAINFRTEMLKGVHSPSDVLSPFSQKISSERNSALKNFKPKSLMDRLLSSQLGTAEPEQHKPLKSSLNQNEDDDDEEEQVASDLTECEHDESEPESSECEKVQ